MAKDCSIDGPEMLSPADHARDVASPITFRWSSVSGAVSYTVTYSVNGGPGDKNTLGTTTGTSLTATLPAGDVKWRVYANAPASEDCKPRSRPERHFDSIGAPACTIPAVTTQPTGKTIGNGERASLTIAVSGTAPVTVEWFEGNAGNTANKVGSGTSFTTPVLTSTTTYWARATNSCGSVNSAAATVTVTPACSAPAVTRQPAAQTISSGQSASLSITTSGTAPVTVEWFEGAAGNTSNKVGTGTAFNTPALTSTTTYWARATNSCGTVNSNAATITVTPTCSAPVITSQPAAQTITSGQSASLSITTSGTAPVTVEWFEGAAGNTSNKVGTGTAFNTPALTSTTTYWARATNSCGTANSNAATITVTASCSAPVVTSQPSAQSITSGQTASLSVTTSGTAPVTVEWFEGAAGNTATKVGTGSTFNTPALTSTTTYWARATNSCGTVNSNAATISVTASCSAPAITGQPAAQSISSGQSASLSITASGTAPVTVEWFEGAAGDSSIKVGNGTTFKTPALISTTSYWARATNSCGTAGSNAAVITVAASCTRPSITTQPENRTVPRGQQARLTLTASGTAPLQIDWYEGVTGNTSRLLGSGPAFNTPAVTRSMQYWASVENACGRVSTDTIRVAPNACGIDEAPDVAVVARAVSGQTYSVRWQPMPGALQYEVQESPDQSFATPSSIVVTLPAASFTQQALDTPQLRYYRVRAFATCDGSAGPFSSPAKVTITPVLTNTSELGKHVVAEAGSKEIIPITVQIPAIFGKTGSETGGYAVTSDRPWLTINSGSNTSGGGSTVNANVNPANLSAGTHTATVILTSTSSNRVVATSSVSVSLVTPVTPATTGSGEVLVVPAVAHADGNGTAWQSDLRISNISSQPIRYEIVFRRSGESDGQQTSLTIEPGDTAALDDIVLNWFGAGLLGETGTGVLEIRPLDHALRAAGAPIRQTTVASSRTYNRAATGTFGQFIPAIPLTSFIRSSSAGLALPDIAQTAQFRTNLGLVEASGAAADVRLKIFDRFGSKVREELISLGANQHRQISSFLQGLGTGMDSARVEVEVAGGEGRVTAYSSTVDNSTGDPLYVNGLRSDSVGVVRSVIPGIADLTAGEARWRSDVRLFNPSAITTHATLRFIPEGQTEAVAVRELDLAAGSVTQLDGIVASMFDLRNRAGVLQVETAEATPLVGMGRTFNESAAGTYGQFIPAVTAADATAIDRQPLQILQLEDSDRYRTNIGLVEVTGKTAKVRLSATLPDSRLTAQTEITLAPNEYRQLNSVLRSMVGERSYNVRVAVEVIDGAGMVAAYGSVIDNRTSDPTYVPAQ